MDVLGFLLFCVVILVLAIAVGIVLGVAIRHFWIKFWERKERPGYRRDCPPTREQIGRGTWAVLHTAAERYPERPTESEKDTMNAFFYALGDIYPCPECAQHFRQKLKRRPPNVNSRRELMQWLCSIHNDVNEDLGKPIFNCNH